MGSKKGWHELPLLMIHTAIGICNILLTIFLGIIITAFITVILCIQHPYSDSIDIVTFFVMNDIDRIIIIDKERVDY